MICTVQENLKATITASTILATATRIATITTTITTPAATITASIISMTAQTATAMKQQDHYVSLFIDKQLIWL